MKNLRYLLSIALFILILNGYKAHAQEPSSLSNFKQINVMDDRTFTDVHSDDWFYGGIRTAYGCTVMDGVGNGRFSPDSNMTLAQAVTIAARIYSVYTGGTISDTGSGVWYDKFFAYAGSNHLLPPDIADESKLDGVNATRAQIAYMFSRILSDADSSPINDLTIPDLQEIRSDYKDAVMKMYASGIVGGKNGGIFDADGLATRAEVAVMVARILDPLCRLSHDSKYNAQTAGQEGNIQNSQKVLEAGDFNYFIYYDRYQYNIAQYNPAAKKVSVIYYGKPYQMQSSYSSIYGLSMFGGELYFIDRGYDSNLNWKCTLKKINVTTKNVTEIYSSDDIDAYIFYNGELYILSSNDLDKKAGPQYKIDKIIENRPVLLVKGTGYADGLSAVNSRLYFHNNDNIVEYNLDAGTQTILIQNVSCSTISGNVVCYTDKDGAVYMTMLSNLSAKKLLYSGYPGNKEKPKSMNYYKGSLYISFGQSAAVDCFSADGKHSVYPVASPEISFAVLNGNLVYSDKYGVDYIAPFGSDPSSHRELIAWLFHPDFSKISRNPTSSVKALPGPAAGSPKKLTAEEVYAKCSPAVFYIEIYNSKAQIIGTASGFFISSDGVAVTNYHVLGIAAYAKVQLADGRSLWVESILGEDEAKDISIFKVPGSGYSCLSIGSSSAVMGGQTVYTIGSPLGLESTISAGLVSNPKRQMEDGNVWIQITAPISPGSSGGALINEYGQVIGITSATYSYYYGQNLNLAIPIGQIYSIKLK